MKVVTFDSLLEWRECGEDSGFCPEPTVCIFRSEILGFTPIKVVSPIGKYRGWLKVYLPFERSLRPDRQRLDSLTKKMDREFLSLGVKAGNRYSPSDVVAGYHYIEFLATNPELIERYMSMQIDQFKEFAFVDRKALNPADIGGLAPLRQARDLLSSVSVQAGSFASGDVNALVEQLRAIGESAVPLSMITDFACNSDWLPGSELDLVEDACALLGKKVSLIQKLCWAPFYDPLLIYSMQLKAALSKGGGAATIHYLNYADAVVSECLKCLESQYPVLTETYRAGRQD